MSFLDTPSLRERAALTERVIASLRHLTIEHALAIALGHIALDDLRESAPVMCGGDAGAATPASRDVVVAAACRIGGITLSLPRPARHHHIMHAAHAAGMPGPIPPADQGFLSRDGQYLTRREAWAAVVAAGQPFAMTPSVPGTLYSEDVW